MTYDDIYDDFDESDFDDDSDDVYNCNDEYDEKFLRYIADQEAIEDRRQER